MPWSSQPMPYASTFMAPPAWPMYINMPSYVPRSLTQPPFMQAQFEELARQREDIEVRELVVQRMSHNLNVVRNARVRSATSVRGNKCTHDKEQAPGLAGSQSALQRSQTPSGAPPSGIEVISTVFLKSWRPLLQVRLALARIWRLWYSD